MIKQLGIQTKNQGYQWGSPHARLYCFDASCLTRKKRASDDA